MLPTIAVYVNEGVVWVPEIVWESMADLDTKDRWERGDLVGRRTIERSIRPAESTVFYGSPKPLSRNRSWRIAHACRGRIRGALVGDNESGGRGWP